MTLLDAAGPAGTDVGRTRMPWGAVSFVLALAGLATAMALDHWWPCGCSWRPFSLPCLLGTFATFVALPGLVLGFVLSIFTLVRRPGQREWALAALGADALFVVLSPNCTLRSCLSRAEVTAIVDTRTIINAESAYAQSGGGHYDTLECLARPATCVRAYPASGPVLDTQFLAAERVGSRRTFHPGPPIRDAVSPSALDAFAYTAIVTTPGRMGRLSFCGDSTGNICVMSGGPPPVTQGRCEIGKRSPCQLLR